MSYLEDSFFSVYYGTAKSLPKPINVGVHQEAEIAPLLFNISIYDQPTLPNSLVADYADEKTLIAMTDLSPSV